MQETFLDVQEVTKHKRGYAETLETDDADIRRSVCLSLPSEGGGGVRRVDGEKKKEMLTHDTLIALEISF